MKYVLTFADILVKDYSAQRMLTIALLFLVVSSTYAVWCPAQGEGQDYVYKVPQHACACNPKTAGTLRYNDNQVQFCNGKEYVNMGVPPASLGSKENPGKSCNDILAEDSSAESGVYYLNLNGEATKTYCYMEEMCGSKGWTMIMKIDGGKTTFSYDSARWTDKHSYNEASASGGLDNEETKLNTYYSMPFTKLCLGMKTNGLTKWLRLNYNAKSLYSVIHDGVYRPTHIGRNAWKSLISSSSLQRNCNREGYNVRVGTGSMARIGIIANQENNCASPDSRIGFGTAGHYCGQNNKHSAGNEARCHPDNGDRSTPSFGYIFAQERLENAVLGSHDNPAPSCRDIKNAIKGSRNGQYYLKLGAKSVKTFCVMDNVCGSSGWALIMKINGRKTTFSYNSAYWNTKVAYNPAGAAGGLDDKETKLETYSDLPFNALCLGMKTGNTRKWLKLPQKASSLYSLIADNKYRPTRLGRSAWKSLIEGSSLQRHCNREGFNVRVGTGSMARIGIISNQENNCASPDSRIGFGTAGHHCGQNNRHSAGNEARCHADNGNRSTPSIGYILAQ